MDSFRNFQEIYTTKFFKLERSESLENTQDPYYRFTGNDSVISLVLNQKDEFVMVRQFRPALQNYTIEMPAGSIENKEIPLKAIAREIKEEVGFSCDLIQLGQFFHLMMNRTNEKTFLFFGMNTVPVENFIEEEGVDVVYVPRKKFFKLALKGEYVQLAGITIIKLVETVLKVNIENDSYKTIHKKFLQKIKIT